MSGQGQFKRGTAARWTSVNPVLAIGELGLETDTNKMKFGDGASHWSSLPYANIGNTGPQGPTGPQGTGINRVVTTTMNFGNEDTYIENTVLDAAITSQNNILAFTYDADFIMQKVFIYATNIQAGVGYTLCATAPEGASGVMNVIILII